MQTQGEIKSIFNRYRYGRKQREIEQRLDFENELSFERIIEYIDKKIERKFAEFKQAHQEE